MELNFFLIFLILQAYYEDTRAYQGVNRIDDDATYLKHQNIVKAIDQSQPAWLYGYSLNGPSPTARLLESLENLKDICVYFTKQSLSNTNVNFTKHIFKKKNGEDGNSLSEGDGKQQEDKYVKEKDVLLYGRFFNTSIINNKGQKDVRDSSNAITVTTMPDEQEGQRYKLLYSDDRDCSILRPLGKGKIPDAENDQSYYTNTPTNCILLLSDVAARGPAAKRRKFAQNFKLTNAPKGMPQDCEWAYLNLCGKEIELKVVFDKDCPSIPNPLGC